MINSPKITRRSFIIGSAVVGGGLALGLRSFRRPQGGARRGRRARNRRLGGHLRPDDTVVVRIARSEMGRARSPGLAQMAPRSWNATGRSDWEYPTPGANVARKRVWGDFGTGGQPRHPYLA